MSISPSDFLRRKKRRLQCSLAKTYQALSSASVDELWRQLIDIADVSWHPLLASTDVPKGLVVKPGLIYQAVTRLIPIPIHIFVERVNPGELLSIRILVMPGLEEQVSYQVKSTVCGTCITYSVTIRGWLSPLVWSLTQHRVARVASQLAAAAERAALPAIAPSSKVRNQSCLDF
jgi:hypothetical protein